MRANRVQRLFALVLVSAGMTSGCQWARNVTWDLSTREIELSDQPLDPARSDPAQDASDRKSVAAQRAQNEAAFRATNPGARPGGPR
jgi:hypothetical protein